MWQANAEFPLFQRALVGKPRGEKAKANNSVSKAECSAEQCYSHKAQPSLRARCPSQRRLDNWRQRSRTQADLKSEIGIPMPSSFSWLFPQRALQRREFWTDVPECAIDSPALSHTNFPSTQSHSLGTGFQGPQPNPTWPSLKAGDLAASSAGDSQPPGGPALFFFLGPDAISRYTPLPDHNPRL